MLNICAADCYDTVSFMQNPMICSYSHTIVPINLLCLKEPRWLVGHSFGITLLNAVNRSFGFFHLSCRLFFPRWIILDSYLLQSSLPAVPCFPNFCARGWGGRILLQCDIVPLRGRRTIAPLLTLTGLKAGHLDPRGKRHLVSECCLGY